MLVNVLIGLAVVVALLLIVVALQPGTYRVARSTIVQAPPAVVWEEVNDFHRWTWNPWSKVDPQMTVTYAESDAGPGAVYTWDGNKNVGAGRMTILDSTPGELVRIKLEFFRPFASVCTAEFTFQPEGEQTRATWAMTGDKPFMAKAMHLLISMDKMIGGEFEKGLAEMKSIAEARAKVRS